jgi:hypothetical protein
MPGQVVQDTFTGDVTANLQNLVRQSMARLDFFHTLVWIHRMTPATVPYYSGDSYEYFLYGWIPRAIWPDKPVAQQGQHRFEVDYQLLTPAQLGSASIGIGQLSEAYANFGWLGILIVMALQGAVFAALGEVFNGPESEGGRAIYLWIMASFLNGIGADTTTTFGGIVQNSVAFALILRLFATGWRAPSPAAARATPRRRTVATRPRSPQATAEQGT